MPRFKQFACVDWSGAKGGSHPGIQLAICSLGETAPRLVPPPTRHWSRQGIADWLLAQHSDLLIGFDCSFAPPLVERGCYLPGEQVPSTAREFWAYVDATCDDEDLGAASFLEIHHRRHFYFGSADGAKAHYMHWRQSEILSKADSGKTSTVFDAIGAAQVAKASFAGMRMLNHIAGKVAIWPFDLLPKSGPVVVEIYTSIAARAAGIGKGRSKIRDTESLDLTLANLGSKPHGPLDRLTDHATDAILTAAWLRQRGNEMALWKPSRLTPYIARTEGWTFGVL